MMPSEDVQDDLATLYEDYDEETDEHFSDESELEEVESLA